NKKVYMKVMFVDDTDRKRADLNINGHLYRIDQYDKTFEREIMNWIEEDNNFVKLTPKTTLDIVEIIIEVEK
ncbi:MAG: hypothetical protein ABIJ08_05970, partial [Nanoarchaeota archaeon]